MKKLDVLAAALLVIGGLNWGLVAIADFDLVAWIVGLDFGQTNAASRIVYGLVGLAAIYQIAQQRAIRQRWGNKPRLAHASHHRTGGVHGASHATEALSTTDHQHVTTT